MSVQDQCAKQCELAAWVDARFKIAFPTDRRSLIALGCFDLAIEHHAAILTLCNGQLYGSMFALLRVAFEAYVRGTYLRHCASDENLDKFGRDQLNKTFWELVSDVEETIGMASHPLRHLQDNKSWRFMNSFTHTGFQHIVRRHDDGKTGSINYSDDEIIQALKFSGLLLLLSAAELAALAGSEPLRQEVLAETRAYVA